jgi:hypothetical protein
MFIPDLGFQIPDPTRTKKRGGIFVLLFVDKNFTKFKKIFYFLKDQKYGFRIQDARSGIGKKSSSRNQESKKHRIPDTRLTGATSSVTLQSFIKPRRYIYLCCPGTIKILAFKACNSVLLYSIRLLRKCF